VALAPGASADLLSGGRTIVSRQYRRGEVIANANRKVVDGISPSGSDGLFQDAHLLPLGACPTLPSGRGEGGAARCEAAGPEKLEVDSLEYIEDFFGPRTMQMVSDRSPQ